MKISSVAAAPPSTFRASTTSTRRPAPARIGGGNAESILRQPPDRAIVDDLAIVIAPGAVEDLTDLAMSHIARHDAIHNGSSLRASDVVLEKWGDVDQRG
ncbi:MAG: hypothetical protein O6949_00815 [Chloroflexi bacterium]|nr:hypothetical protein [Chloroflexota bacterium]